MKTKQDIEKILDENYDTVGSKDATNDILALISTKLKEAIPKKKMIPPFVSDSPESMTIQEVTMRTAYNQAIDEVLSIIDELLTEKI